MTKISPALGGQKKTGREPGLPSEYAKYDPQFDYRIESLARNSPTLKEILEAAIAELKRQLAEDE